MSIGSTINRNDYTGDGGTSVYNYGFYILQDSDLTVITRDTSGVETQLTLNTDYTVSGAGSASGGSITLTAGNLTSGYAITIRRKRPLTQQTDIRNQGDYYPEVHEDAFDHFVMIAQQQQDDIDRSIRVPQTYSSLNVELPTPVANRLLGWDASASAIANFASAGEIITTSFSESLLDDANAQTARTTLGFSGSGGTVATANIEDLAVTNAKLAASAVTYPKITSSILTNQSIINTGLEVSVAGNAMTIALKQADGSTNATSTSPSAIVFRSSTATTGGNVTRTVTGALSMTVSSGSTLGTASSSDHYLYVYAIDNAGSVELAVSMSLFDESSLVSTTAEGGAGAADSNSVLYSTTARSNVACRLIGRLKVNETVAGTWASGPSEVSIFPFAVYGPQALYRNFTTQSVNTEASLTYTSGDKITDNFNMFVDASEHFLIAMPGVYHIVGSANCAVTTGGNLSIMGFRVNSTTYQTTSIAANTSFGQIIAGSLTVRLAVGDTVAHRGSITISANVTDKFFSIAWLGF